MCAGVALRLMLAQRLDSAAEWESDTCLWAWADADTRALASGCRPAGLQSLWAVLGGVTSTPSLAALRVGAVGLSVAAWACAWWLALALLQWRGASPRAISRARLVLSVAWAASPTLLGAGPRFVPELISGGLLCLVAGAAVRVRLEPSLGRWLGLCIASAVAVSVGGVGVAFALCVGLGVFLLCLPRFSVALTALAVFLVAAVGAVAFARAQDDSRPWRPDSGPAYAVAALVGAPVILDDRESGLPEVRSDAVWRQCGRTIAAQPVSETLMQLGGRARSLIAPDRFSETTGGLRTAIGAVDALVTGALLLLGLLTLFRRAGSQSATGSRALTSLAGGTALLAWSVASIAGATGPFALGGVLLVLLALATVELSTGDHPPRRLRWQLALSVLLGSGLTWFALRPPSGAPPPSQWLDDLTQIRGQGRRLTALLAAPEPLSAVDHRQFAQLLIDPAAPFLRRPLLAREHAIAAVAEQPNDEETLMLLARTQVDCLEFDAAEDLAASLIDDLGQTSLNGRVLRDWVRSKEHRARLDGLR